MEKEYSRRRFIQAMGIGITSIALGSSLASCKQPEEEKMDLKRLSEYHVFKNHLESINEDNYLFIRELRYLDTYMYLYLNISEDKYFYDNVFIRLEDEQEKVDLETGTDHVPFAPLIKYTDLDDLGNAVDVVSDKLGRKEEYSASEIEKMFTILQEKNKEYVKKNR